MLPHYTHAKLTLRLLIIPHFMVFEILHLMKYTWQFFIVDMHTITHIYIGDVCKLELIHLQYVDIHG